MKLLHNTKTQIMQYLYGKTDKAFDRTMDKLGEQNYKLKHVGTCSFMYKGYTHYHTLETHKASIIPRLHKSLHDQANELVDMKFKEDNEIKPYIESVITIWLKFVNHDNMDQIIPTELRPIIKVYLMYSNYSSQKIAAPEYVKNLLQSHTKGIQAIKEQLVINHLM